MEVKALQMFKIKNEMFFSFIQIILYENVIFFYFLKMCTLFFSDETVELLYGTNVCHL